MEATRDDYKSPLPEKLRWRNWAADAEGMTGDGLQKFVNDDLFPRLKDLKGTTPRHHLLRAAFEDAYNNITREGVAMLPVAPPPLAEQQRIVAKVDELMRWCDALEVRLADAQTTATRLLDVTLHQILEPVL